MNTKIRPAQAALWLCLLPSTLLADDSQSDVLSELSGNLDIIWTLVAAALILTIFDLNEKLNQTLSFQNDGIARMDGRVTEVNSVARELLDQMQAVLDESHVVSQKVAGAYQEFQVSFSSDRADQSEAPA